MTTTTFAYETQELINLAVIQEVFTEEEASQKEEVIRKLLQATGKTSKASLDSYLVRNVIAPYRVRLQERL